jgi:hypothetical protein
VGISICDQYWTILNIWTVLEQEAVLWNKLATLQDVHDQESNAPSATLAK